MTLVKTNQKENSALFADFFDTTNFFSKNLGFNSFGRNMPAVNIKETNKDFNLEFAAPGFKKEDIKVSIDDNILTISAEKENEKQENSERYTRKEFSYNSFSRAFSLPESVSFDKIDANYTDGVLKLSIPKKVVTRTVAKKEIKVL
jgi:HSP20 family protein